MTVFSILLTLLLLAPSVAIAAFWRTARQRQIRVGGLPDVEALILARVGGILCGVLPGVQLLASLVRYKTGDAGTYLWYLVPIGGTALAVLALTGFLSYARSRERMVSSTMVLLSVSLLLLLTFVTGISGS